ncbi:MAG: Hint domain-containing protein [Pseudomonadota bacterium]
MATGEELSIDQGATAIEMANAIFGSGVEVLGASYTGDARSSGIYSGGLDTSENVVPSDSGLILSTGRVEDFTQSDGDPNRVGNLSTNTSGPNNEPDFNALAGAPTRDAAYIDVDFRPVGDTITMQFVLSSDEYPEFVNSVYTDFVGVWVNGTPVPLAVGDGGSDIDNIAPGTNLNLYRDNTGDDFNTEMDGFTVTLTLKANVTPGAVNSIRIGVADVTDSAYDTNLLVAADSIQTSFIAADDTVTVVPGGTRTIDVLANDASSASSTLTITHINGTRVFANDSVDLPTGQTVRLNPDGTLTVIADADTETVSLTYQAIDGAGTTDTAFITIDSVPCFVAGCLIRTPGGSVAVETLAPGDLVTTRDAGAQPLRWVGARRVAAKGDHAPIQIAAGALGDHGALLLSPLHRVLVRDFVAELLFGEREVLVAARDLVNDTTICPRPGGQVTYVHILFDDHQVVYCEGLETESFLPGPQTKKSFEAEMVAEICDLFPELDPITGDGYGPAARRTLRRYEANLLVNKGRVA